MSQMLRMLLVASGYRLPIVKGVKIGAQYASIDPKGVVDAYTDHLPGNAKSSDAYAVKLAYEGVENLKVSAAYSETDKDGLLKIANTATNNLETAQSKLYTEAWWNYGYVGAPGAESMNVTAEYDAGVAKVGVYFTDVDVKPTGAATTTDMTEIAVTASKDFGPLNATLAYISTDADDQNQDVNNNGQRYDSIQAYLTLNF
jgi:imipenem/basic amino acid-specific outer membrane pore